MDDFGGVVDVSGELRFERVDVLLHSLVAREKAVDEIVRRAAIYRDAGCDGIFVPYLVDTSEISMIVAAVDPLPLNVLAFPALPPAGELKRLGVRRLSAGTAISRAALALTKKLANDFLREGNSDAIFEATLSKIDMNGLLEK